MDLFGVGPLELLLVLLLAVILFGPKDLVNNARAVGRYLNRLYKSESWRTIVQASSTLRTLPNRLAREAELEQLESLRRELDDPAGAAARPQLEAGMEAWIRPPPKPAPPPSPPSAEPPAASGEASSDAPST